MKSHKLFTLALAGSLLAATGCKKDLLNQTNPNTLSVAQYWLTGDDANKGIIACYSGVQQYACYGHSWQFITARSDESYSQSPFVELAVFTRFVQANNNFFISAFAWNDYYRTIYRCNQALHHIPDITSMDATLQKQYVAEARFVRALMYFDLDSFFGNVPLITEDPTVTTRVKQVTPAEVEAQVILDLQAAIPDLPVTYPAANLGRATKGAAQALLAKMYMQQHKYQEASTLFAGIISSGKYSLTPNYLDNFTEGTENNSESLFEVQYVGSPLDVGQGQDNASASEGYDRPNFFGPPVYSFADVQPRQWLTAAYTDSTVALVAGTKKHAIDPRRDISIISVLNPDKFYGKTFTQLGYDPSQQYWRKYLNDRTRTTPENFTSGINFRVIRYADVLLLQAEALNELGQPAAAVPLVNQVRARVGLGPVSAANSSNQAALRLYMRDERARELAGEGQRWFDINRWGLLDNQTGLNYLIAKDPDFTNFVLGKSKLLPIPQTDIDLDPTIKQNTGY